MPNPPNTPPLAVITGASSGIGREIAVRLARRGWRTVLIARRVHLLDRLAAELSHHAPSFAYPLDLADLGDIPGAAAAISAAHGAPGVLINNAGIGAYRPFLDHPVCEFDRIMRINFDAAVHMTRAFLPVLLDRAAAGERAHVLNVCSMSARAGPWGHAAYASSKGAMRSFTEVMHAEHARRGVRFTSVYPGIVDTPYFTKGSMARLWPQVCVHAVSVESVAEAVVRAIGTRRVTVYAPAHCRALDWITAASPRLAQWLVCRASIAPHAKSTAPA